MLAAVVGAVLVAGTCSPSLEPGNAARGHEVVLKKCTFCHFVEGRGGLIAPPLEQAMRLAEEVVRDYEKRAARLKTAEPKAYEAARGTIESVLAEPDPTRRLERWYDAYLRDTKFDNPRTRMGNVLMSDQQRLDVVAWLMTRRSTP